jgi:trimethylamine--corrinoid protein Co-methyltransferase
MHQLFRGKYGLSLGVEPAYIEGRTPGIQTTFMKIFRQMAFASSAAMSLPVGLLDNATVFSPAQAMLDLDLNRAVYGFARGMDVNDETMCVDLINDRTFCEKQTYLESEHTLRHFREVLWDAKFFDRSCCDISEGKAEFDEDREMLAKADRAWREVLEAHEPIQRDKAFLAELDRIVEAGKKELLSRQPQEDA